MATSKVPALRHIKKPPPPPPPRPYGVLRCPLCDLIYFEFVDHVAWDHPEILLSGGTNEVLCLCGSRFSIFAGEKFRDHLAEKKCVGFAIGAAANLYRGVLYREAEPCRSSSMP